jgi:hypothetical protein
MKMIHINILPEDARRDTSLYRELHSNFLTIIIMLI